MTLSEYFSALSEFLLKNPSLGGCKVVYSGDDEGNHFYPVLYTPSVMYWGGEGCHITAHSPDAEEVVCIN